MAKRKKCSKCGKIQDIENFGSHKTSSDGHQSYCKGCKSGLHKIRRDRNVGFRIKHHFATRVKTQLGENCPDHMYKNLEKLLGYTFRALRAALDANIKDRVASGDITEEGIISAKTALQAGWHIDHKTPLHSFMCKEVVTAAGLENFQDCWRIKNLILISAAENLAKGGRVNA